jgi:hypothetical protein
VVVFPEPTAQGTATLDQVAAGAGLPEELAAAADGLGTVRYTEVGPVSLKGLAAPVTVYLAARAP